MKEYFVRYIEIYENKEFGELVDEIKLTIDEESVSGITVDELKNLFKLKKYDPNMADPCEITEKQADFFRKKLNIEFDFEKYAYYVQGLRVKEHEL